MRSIITVVILIGLTVIVSGQSSNISFTGGGGFNLSHTDIETTNGFHGYLGIAYRIHPAFELEASGTVGNLLGDERVGAESLSFSNSFTQLSLRTNLHLLPIFGGSNDKLDLFLSTGAGLGLSNITEITTPENDPWGNAYSGTDVFVPIGGGVRIPISSSLALNFHVLYNITFTDELDGYNPQVAANEASDYFTNLGIGLVFRPKKKTQQEDPAVTEEDIIVQEEPEEQEEIVEEPTEEEQEVTPEEETEEEETEEEAEEETQENPTPAEEEEQDEPLEGPSTEENDEPEIDTSATNVNVFRDLVFNVNGSRANKRYYVIGASFKTMSLAQEYQFEMAAKGYATLIVTDYQRQVYRISFGGYMQYAAAEKLAEKLKREHDPDTWIIENARPE